MGIPIASLGAIPTKPDKRDFTLETVGLSTMPTWEEVKARVPDHRFNQLRVGKCGGTAGGVVLNQAEYREKKVDVTYSDDYIYTGPYMRDHFGPGMTEKELCQNLLHAGSCYLSDFDENVEIDKLRPLYEKKKIILDERAFLNRIDNYFSVKTIGDIISVLKNYQTGILTMIPIHENFIPNSKGIIPMPKGSKLGYHWVVIHETKQIGEGKYKGIINSWGKGWGIDGIAYLPLDYPVVTMKGVTSLSWQKLVKNVDMFIFKKGMTSFYADKERIELDTEIWNDKNGRMQVPIRALLEKLGYNVHYENQTAYCRLGRSILEVK